MLSTVIMRHITTVNIHAKQMCPRACVCVCGINYSYECDDLEMVYAVGGVDSLVFLYFSFFRSPFFHSTLIPIVGHAFRCSKLSIANTQQSVVHIDQNGYIFIICRASLTRAVKIPTETAFNTINCCTLLLQHLLRVYENVLGIKSNSNKKRREINESHWNAHTPAHSLQAHKKCEWKIDKAK